MTEAQKRELDITLSGSDIPERVILSSRWKLAGKDILCHRVIKPARYELYRIRPDGTREGV